jgi:hypothetical protein
MMSWVEVMFPRVVVCSVDFRKRYGLGIRQPSEYSIFYESDAARIEWSFERYYRNLLNDLARIVQVVS